MAKNLLNGLWNLLTVIGGVGETIWLCRISAITIGGIFLIDVTNIQIPSEFLVATVMTALILGVLFGLFVTLWMHEKAADKKIKNGKIKSTADLPYDNRYIGASVIGSVLSMLFSVGATPIVAQNEVVGGGIWTYVTIVAILTPIVTVIFVAVLHWVARVCVVRYSDYRYVLKAPAAALTDEEKAIINNYLVTHGKAPKF